MDLFVDGATRLLACGGFMMRCALGRGGVSYTKREGDGATPMGIFPLRRLLYRADRVETPESGLPVAAIRESDGWCDDPRVPEYNMPVTLPFAASHEEMWRQDGLYDLVVVIGYNDEPPVRGLGSAIFLHVAGPGFMPTQGCVALALEDLVTVVHHLTPASKIRIG